jgi:diacylglycerol kinase family enzyme
MVGRHLEHDLVEYFRAARVKVLSEPAMRFNVDGEVECSTPLEFEVVAGGLRLLAPEEGARVEG